ncbi:MAG TPA: RluA family pseudouridine synthase [Desulfotignum sp.]|nr:RluA family pseudouridine synthase [Desulfotignum sp.]
MKIDWIVDGAATGRRLDFLLSRAVEGCSRSLATAWIKQGNIQVSGQQKQPGYRVKKSDRITGTVSRPGQPLTVAAEPGPVSVVYADAHILVLDKVPGLVVHPGAGCQGHTLVNRLLFHYPEIKDVGDDPLRPGIVHRLDKDTSGLMLVARTAHSLDFLQKEFQYHRVKKTYLALVAGTALPDAGNITLPVGRHPKHRKRMAVIHETGKPAHTSWQVCRRFSRACLVRVQLHTGRTHQIRVHFYAMDHPLLGDPVYQYRRNRRKQQVFPRQMLHSWKIAFKHPCSGQKMRFTTDPPQDFATAVETEAAHEGDGSVSTPC